MNPNVLTAAISAGAAVLTAVIALVLNHRTFAMLDNRIGDTNRRIDDTSSSIGRRLDDTNRRIDDTSTGIGRRLDDTNTGIGRRLDDQNKRLDTVSQDLREMRTDLKQFFQIQADLDKRLGRIEDKLGIPPR
jgi:septal ring factor EnvC (AmiA/AmiB activator)